MARQPYGENRAPIPAIEQPSLVFIITKSLGTRGAGEKGIYDATRYGWRVGAKTRETAVFALGAANGVIHGAYRIDDWKPREGEPGRWEFVGVPARELDHVVGTSISRLRRAQGSGFMLFLNGIPADGDIGNQ